MFESEKYKVTFEKVIPIFKDVNPKTKELGLGFEFYGKPAMICNILDKDGKKTYSGISYCSYKDDYDSINGKKISLTRALSMAIMAKPDKALIWGAFLEKYHIVNTNTISYCWQKFRVRYQKG